MWRLLWERPFFFLVKGLLGSPGRNSRVLLTPPSLGPSSSLYCGPLISVLQPLSPLPPFGFLPSISLLWFLFPFSSLLLPLLPSQFSSSLFIQNKGCLGECTFIFLLLIFLLNTPVSSEKHLFLGLLFPETIIYLFSFYGLIKFLLFCEFSHWQNSGLRFKSTVVSFSSITKQLTASFTLAKMKWKLLSRVWLFMTPWTVAKLLCPWKSPGRNTAVGCCSLLQGSSQPRYRTQVSAIAGGFFPVWANGEEINTSSAKPTPNPQPHGANQQLRSFPGGMLGQRAQAARGLLCFSWWKWVRTQFCH